MNKTDKLAQEQFGGDQEAAVRHIIRTFETEELNEYASDFNKEQAVLLLKIIAELATSCLSKEEIADIAGENYILSQLGMTKEEVCSAEQNPFERNLIRRLLILLMVVAVPIGIAVLFSDLGITMELAASISGILISIMVIPLGEDTIKYFKFRKLKKKYRKSGESA